MLVLVYGVTIAALYFLLGWSLRGDWDRLPR
jgi:hypothetical protein